ncbi:hypothetical protein MWMV18_MWMV18_01439 [Acinetobacter calcoaceticus]|nr:hypothetical protein MWMV18_MWMV18_01439 [Acinetobacter calcoaceticus]
MPHKFELIVKLFLSYVFLLLLCFLFYSLVVLPVTEAEKVNAIIGLFGWSATIYAPIAAYILLDNWKAQNHYIVKINILIEMIDTIEKFSKAIDSLRGADTYEPLLKKQIDFELDLNELQFELHDLYENVNQSLKMIKILENKVRLIQNQENQNPVFGDTLNKAKELSLTLYKDIIWIYSSCYSVKRKIYDKGERPKTFAMDYKNEDLKRFINLSFMSELYYGNELNYKFSNQKSLLIEDLNKKVVAFRKTLD